MHFKYKEKDGLEVKGYKNIYNTNRKYKKVIVSVLLFEKVDFQTKIIIRNKKGKLHSEKSINLSGRHTVIMAHVPNNWQN